MSTHLIGQCIKYFVAVDNLWQTQYSEVIAECLRGSSVRFFHLCRYRILFGHSKSAIQGLVSVWWRFIYPVQGKTVICNL